ncbi:MAG TPA: class I SAM-dependent methyltransferase [Solirubrobacteraceae bacterium]|nr:class I SAM-dependent methyltransferase [Solirubrobacteraceae bacterium]
MRDPLGLNERLFAWWYPYVSGLSERAGQREMRAELIAQAHGRALEIGAGSGLNLPHYGPSVSELVVTEPSPHMLAHLRRRLEQEPPPVGEWTLLLAGAETLPFEDASFDCVVGTYVHCTIPDPARALREVARVLAPGGRYLYLEHVHAGEGTALGRMQDLIELPHRYIAAGCHPNRRTERLLRDSPLVLERVEHGTMPMAFPSVRPVISGSARAPAR